MTDVPQTARPATPGSVAFALHCFAIAVIVPLMALFAEHKGNDGAGALGPLLFGLLAGAVAALLGIICTIVGARRQPRSVATMIAIVLACLFGGGLLVLLGVL